MEKIRKPFWFSLPRHQNPKAIIPLYLSAVGSFCWETAAFWADEIHADIWIALILVGLICMLLGFIGGCIYRHYKIAAPTVIISLLSPLLWFFVLLYLHPFFGHEPQPGFLLNLWLALQIPPSVIAWRQCRWPSHVKIAVLSALAFVLICILSFS
jgi:hypothetical protein